MHTFLFFANTREILSKAGHVKFNVTIDFDDENRLWREILACLYFCFFLNVADLKGVFLTEFVSVFITHITVNSLERTLFRKLEVLKTFRDR